MEKIENLLKKTAHRIKLTPSEKESGRIELLAFMRENMSVRNMDSLRLKRQGLANLSSIFIFLTDKLMFKFKPVHIVVALVALLSTGVVFAAEGAMPGEPLYSVKVNINEKVQGLLALSGKQKASVAIHLAERRLKEAEILAINNKLDAETKKELAIGLSLQAKEFNKNIEGLRSKNQLAAASDATSNFTALLEVHEQVLAGVDARVDSKKDQLKNDDEKLETTIKTSQKAILKADSEVKNEITAKADTAVKASAEGKMKAAQNKLDEVTDFTTKQNLNISPEIRAQAEAQLKEAQTIFAEGKTKLEQQNYGEAFVLFQNSMKEAQKAKLLLQTHNELNIKLEITSNALLQLTEKDTKRKKNDAKSKATAESTEKNKPVNQEINITIKDSSEKLKIESSVEDTSGFNL